MNIEKLNNLEAKLENYSKLPDPAIYCFYKDAEDRNLYVYGGIDYQSQDDDGPICNAREIAMAIMEYNKEDRGIPVEERKPISIYIDSNGGSIESTLMLVNTMINSKTPVYTINVGWAYSSAGLILAAGHKRYGFPGTSVLVHSGSMFVGGVKEQAESAKKHLDKLDKKFTDLLLEKTGIDSKTYKAKAPKDWYLDTDEALKYNIIDEVVTDLDILP